MSEKQIPVAEVIAETGLTRREILDLWPIHKSWRGEEMMFTRHARAAVATAASRKELDERIRAAWREHIATFQARRTAAYREGFRDVERRMRVRNSQQLALCVAGGNVALAEFDAANPEPGSGQVGAATDMYDWYEMERGRQAS